MEAQALESDASSDEDVEFDIDVIADQAVLQNGATANATEEIKELGLDVGLDSSALYMTSAEGLKDSCFDTAAVPGRWRARVDDFAKGCGPESIAPAGASKPSREVRGAKVRPTDDSKMRRKEAKEQREAKLDEWYGLPKHKMTPEIEKELRALKNRAFLDPKRFYKANDSKELPKYFTFATEVGGGMAATGERPTVHEPHPLSGKSFISQALGDETAYTFGEKKRVDAMAKAAASKRSGHGSGRPKRGALNRHWNKAKNARKKQ